MFRKSVARYSYIRVLLASCWLLISLIGLGHAHQLNYELDIFALDIDHHSEPCELCVLKQNLKGINLALSQKFFNSVEIYATLVNLESFFYRLSLLSASAARAPPALSV